MHVGMAMAIVSPGMVTCAFVAPKILMHSVLTKSILLVVVVVESRAMMVGFGIVVIVAIVVLAAATASPRRMERVRYEKSMV
jgi:hypothetical protein